jgi:hypothetical protein
MTVQRITGSSAVKSGFLLPALNSVSSKEYERNRLTNWRRMTIRIQGAASGA